MPFIHVLTVGISFNNNVRDRNFRKSKDKLDSSVKNVGPLFEHLSGEADVDETSQWIDRVRAGDRPEIPELIRKLLVKRPAIASAELTAIAATENVPRIRDGDTAILLASDTSAGLTAALYNAIALADCNLSRIKYFHEPGDESKDLIGDIVIHRLSHLDIRNQRFTEAMRGLGRIGRGIHSLMEPPAEAKAIFHLTGGYRPALPFLLSLAEALRGLHRSDVTAYAVPEGSNDAIKLPLRAFSPDLIEDDVKFDQFDDQGIMAVAPSKRLLDTLVYDVEGTSARLTPFGEALRELHRPREQP